MTFGQGGEVRDGWDCCLCRGRTKVADGILREYPIGMNGVG